MGELVSLKKRTWQEHVRLIRESWRQSVEGIIETGRRVATAKHELDHGSFEAMVQNKLPFTPRTARRLMEIARHPVFSNRAHGPDLPASWRTLHQLTYVDKKCGDGSLRRLIKEGKVTSKTERKDVKALIKELDSEPESVRSRIINIVKNARHGMTRDEIEVKHGVPHSNIGRVGELVRDGVLIETKETRPTRTGSDAIVLVYEPNPKPRLDVKKQKKISLRDAEAAIAAQLDNKPNDAREKIIARLADKLDVKVEKTKTLKWKTVGEGKQISYHASTADGGEYHISVSYSVSGNIGAPQEAYDYIVAFKNQRNERYVGRTILLDNAKGLAQFDHERNRSNG